MLALFFLLPLLHAQTYNPNLYELGGNLLVNPSFTSPVMTPSVTIENFSPTILGWNCTTYCQFKNIPLFCSINSLTCNVNYTQAIDLISQVALIENVRQGVQISDQGQYLIHLQWLPPFMNASGKSIAIEVDHVVVAKIDVGTTNYSTHIAQHTIFLSSGSHILNIKMSGASADALGAHVSHIALRKMIPLDEEFVFVMKTLMLNNFTSSMNIIPGSRIFTYTLTNFLVNFDRLQFYYYHKQNLSYYSEIFLSNINTMQIEKGSITQRLLESCNHTQFCSSINNIYNNILNSIDYQKNYTKPEIMQKNPNGIGFFANNLEFFFYQLPLITVIYIIMSLFFKLLFNYRISRYIRKYAFYGILVLIVYEGNIEQFSFYFFSECKNLFSATFSHKISHVLMIYFFFILVVFAVGGLVWFKFHYKKLLKYFLEDSKTTTLEAIMLESLERSIFPLFFGFVHAIFIENLFCQSIILGVVESIYLCFKVYGLRSYTTRYKFRVVMLTFSSLLRMVLIITLYMYESQGHPTVINLMHFDLVWLYIISWAVQSVYDFGVFVKEVVEAIRYVCFYEQKKKEKPKKPANKGKSILKNSPNKKNQTQTPQNLKKEKEKSAQKDEKKRSKSRGGKNVSQSSKTIDQNNEIKERKVKIKQPKEEKASKYIKTTFQIEMPDKSKSPELVFYRKAPKANGVKSQRFI